ncbi:MAG: Grx4 family monothiol glutaredoxin [Acidiferrobacterales bacterium]
MDENTLATIENILAVHPVVLFMKGTPLQPQCGFSAKTAGILDTLLPDYRTVNVLEDHQLREGIKAYGQWPTIPQLYINGELIGGCDIVSDMFESGELYAALGLEPPKVASPRITFSEAAASLIREALEQEPGAVLHLQINARWESQFKLGGPSEHAIRIEVSDMSVLMDPSTADRADGLHVDITDTIQGRGLRFENPNAPPPVKSMSVAKLRERLDALEELFLLDVRDPEERQLAKIHEAIPLDDAADQQIGGHSNNTPLVFHCHTGARSRAAAEYYRLLGFTDVYNLEGGIEAWSIEIDPAVPRY